MAILEEPFVQLTYVVHDFNAAPVLMKDDCPSRSTSEIEWITPVAQNGGAYR